MSVKFAKRGRRVRSMSENDTLVISTLTNAILRDIEKSRIMIKSCARVPLPPVVCPPRHTRPGSVNCDSREPHKDEIYMTFVPSAPNNKKLLHLVSLRVHSHNSEVSVIWFFDEKRKEMCALVKIPPRA